MTYTDQQRAVIEALAMSPDDLRGLAGALENARTIVSVRQIAEAQLAALPRHHRYAKSLCRLIEWAGDGDAGRIRASDVAVWMRRAGVEARADPKARHGIGAEEAMVLAVRAAFAAAIEAGFVRKNPAAQVDLPDRPPTRRAALGATELGQIHQSLLAHSRDPNVDDLVFSFLRETGCRRCGAIRLSHDDLAPATRAVRLIEKYGKQRWVPVSAHLMGRLLSHSGEHHERCNVVLHRNNGGHLNDKWFEGFGRRIQGIPWAAEVGVTAHWIRHTTITDIERIAGVRVAAAYAGHADGSFGATGTYTKASFEELQRAHACLFFDGGEDSGQPPHLFRRALAAERRVVSFDDSR